MLFGAGASMPAAALLVSAEVPIAAAFMPAGAEYTLAAPQAGEAITLEARIPMKADILAAAPFMAEPAELMSGGAVYMAGAPLSQADEEAASQAAGATQDVE
jgi:hypothetical protein